MEEDNKSCFEQEDLAFIAKTIPTYENLDSISSFNSINTLYQIISEYAPNENKGKTVKQKVLLKFCEIIKTSNEKEILALRNIKTKSYEDSEAKLSKALTDWIHTNLFSSSANKEKDYTTVVKQYDAKDKKNWWHVVLNRELKRFLNKINLEKIEVIWQWILNDAAILKSIESEIDDTNSSEDVFVIKFPNETNSTWLSNIRKFALSKKWLKLHAVSLSKEYDFEEALLRQLQVDTDEKYIDGINIITDLAKPKRVIEYSVVNEDIRLIKICGALCRDTPALLNGLDVSNLNWQSIWAESIKNGNKIDEGLNNPKTKIYKLMDLLVQGKEVHKILLEKISLSSYANILEYKNRNHIWEKIPVVLRENFLSKTATSLLEKLSRNSLIEVPDDSFLEEYIISSNAIGDFLYFNKDNFKTTLPIFIKFNELKENILRDYVYNFRGNLDVVDAVQLGQLVARRNYYQVAKAIYNRVGRNSAFLVALNECYFLLGLWEQGFIKLTGLLNNVNFTENMWWEAFQELSYNLYQKGPSDRKIWLAAGGHEYDLLSSGTAKEIWIDALKKLRNHGCEGITVESLIEKMLKDYKNNEELKTLKKLRNKL